MRWSIVLKKHNWEKWVINILIFARFLHHNNELKEIDDKLSLTFRFTYYLPMSVNLHTT